ncbi:MAG: hypothetical protein ACREL5_03135 [Gemmatimonadales bacterium]
MTLVVAIPIGADTVVVADRARLLGGTTPTRRDDNALKIVAAGSRLAIAVVGDVSFGSPRPEDMIGAWMPMLVAEKATDRAQWLTNRASCTAIPTSAAGVLLLFDAEQPGSVAAITISPAPTSAGVVVTLAISALRTDQPQVWGVQSTWAAVSAVHWTPVSDAAAAAAVIRTGIELYAVNNPSEPVSQSTCTTVIRP